MEKVHISTQFDTDLEDIRTRMLQMGGLVEAQVRAAVALYENGEDGKYDSIRATEDRINQFEIDLDDRCTHLIVRRQPAAGDLRLVMAVVKTITDLERIGDEAEKIARTALAMKNRGIVPLRGFSDVHIAANIAAGMLKDSLDAFARLDANMAGRIVRQDEDIDKEFHSILRQLITFMMEDPRTISTALDIIWIAKAIERIGDHAQNIAEYVIFVAKGTDVRHASMEQVEQAIAG
jgi:phosphate transport system protein